MTDQSILDRVSAVIRTTFKQPAVAVDRETTADMMPGWDSLSHAILLMKMEEAFGIRFVPMEVVELENVGDLADVIARKLNEQG